MPVRMPAGAVAMAMVGEVIRAAGIEVAVAIRLAITAVFPGGGTIAHPRLGATHHREVPDDLLRLRAAAGAGRELQGVAHRHALLETLTAIRALVFVESHAAMVERVAR